jgi:hypothetical protein
MAARFKTSAQTYYGWYKANLEFLRAVTDGNFIGDALAGNGLDQRGRHLQLDRARRGQSD